MYKYAFVNHTHGTYTSLYIAVYTKLYIYFLYRNKFDSFFFINIKPDNFQLFNKCK